MFVYVDVHVLIWLIIDSFIVEHCMLLLTMLHSNCFIHVSLLYSVLRYRCW